MTTPKKTDPLTVQEVAEAADIFFELFDEVLDRCPENTSIEDALKLSESIFAYAHQRRSLDAEEEVATSFGFNKKGDS